MKYLFFLLAVGCCLCISCKSNSPSSTIKPLFELVENSGIDFNNHVIDGQLENSFYFRNYYNGGGVATGDLNNDGLADVMMTSNMQINKLYLNRGNFRFEDITQKAGLRQDSMWSTGVVFVDINNDGWLDIYECNSGHMKNGNRRNKLYINQQVRKGDSIVTFKESAKEYGLDIVAYTTQVSFFDYDLDGDLDCFMINNSPIPINSIGNASRRQMLDADWPVSEFLKGGGDHLYRNDNNVFKEVTKEAGIHGSLMSFGLGVSVGDINNDGYPDVFIANDSYERDYLYINQRNGTFTDEIEDWTEHNSFSSMGADICDINNDGYNDIFTTDMLPGDDYRLKTLGAFDNIDLYRTRLNAGFYHQFMKNCLFVNNGQGKLIETANYSGVSGTDWSWGAMFFDADNDGYNDIFVCNGINHDVTNLDFMDFFANEVVQQMVISGEKQNVDSVLKNIPIYKIPNKVFRNKGGLSFQDMGKNWGLDQPSASNGASYADLDNDGDLDLIVNNENQQAFIYRNNAREQNKNNYIGVQIKGSSHNRFGVGARILVYKDKQVFSREVMPSRGFQSSVDYKQIIGLGNISAVDSMVVIWPDRTFSKYDRPVINKVHIYEAAENSPVYGFPTQSTATPLLQSVVNNFEKHNEDDYTDFYAERNLPELLSREGPKATVGDVNGDGMQDVYIGGAHGQAGQLYIQRPDGLMAKKSAAVFDTYAAFEDVAVLFFDADKDGDLDLFIGAGGNNVQPNALEIQHRLYKNDGKGNFEIDGTAFPTNSMNIAVATANDFDGDGDLDLFVGSRSVPFDYGMIPESYLFVNDGTGHFKDMAATLNKNISHVGMVTGAIWADVCGDAAKELIITGQWMPTRVFEFNKATQKFDEKQNTGLKDFVGWWQTLNATDINGDGKMDLVIGNVGENFYLRPDSAAPVQLWLKDFDLDNTVDQFLTRSIDGKDMPVFLKREITDQFPALKKNNLKHSEYATKSIQDLFGVDIIAKAEKRTFNFCKSIIAVNNGNGSFTIKALPLETQLSSVNAVYCGDLNGDGKTDIVTGGNMFGFPPQFGRLDGSYGQVLLNKGNGNFELPNAAYSGLSLRGEIKDIKELTIKNKRCLLVLQNNQVPVMFKLK